MSIHKATYKELAELEADYRDDIVRLWHKTQIGHIDECRKNQLIFADIMWKLYKDYKNLELPEYQSLGDDTI